MYNVHIVDLKFFLFENFSLIYIRKNGWLEGFVDFGRIKTNDFVKFCFYGQ